MFSYGKKNATLFLILYVVNVVVIFVFSLMSSSLSGKLSSLFYDTYEKIRYGDTNNKQIDEVPITSLSLIVTGDTYVVGTKIKLIVDKIEPSNYTESYFIEVSDNEKAEYDGEYLLFKQEGVIDVWAETPGGVRSNVFTMTILQEYDENFEVDRSKFKILLPDELSQNDACGISYTYDGLSPKFKTSFTIEGDCAELVVNRFIVAKKEGEFTFNVIYNEEIVCSKTVTITSNVLPAPVFQSISFDNRPIDGYIELLYKSVYETSVQFKADNCCRLYYMKTEFATLLYNFSADKTQVKALADKLDYDTVSVYSPLDPDTPLYSFRIYVKPPEPVVVGMSIKELSIVGEKYFFLPKFANKLSENGIYVTVEGGKEDDYELFEAEKIKFYKEGLYTLVYHSQYYPDFEYRYDVLIKDNDNANKSRKAVGHAGLFVVLGILATLAFGYFSKKPLFKSIFIASSGIVPAVISEILQLPVFSDGRNATVIDVFIDLGGFAIGVAFIMAVIIIVYYNRKRKSPPELPPDDLPECDEENNLSASDDTER